MINSNESEELNYEYVIRRLRELLREQSDSRIDDAVIVIKQQAEQLESARKEISLLEKTIWHDGFPPYPYCDEWFIAKTEFGRMVLRSLPEEYSFDFTTADGTYLKKEKVKKWMQFPDSGYIPFSKESPKPEDE